MVPPTMGEPSPRYESDQNRAPQTWPGAHFLGHSRVIKLTIEINPHTDLEANQNETKRNKTKQNLPPLT